MASRRASREVNLARCSFLRLASRLFWFCGAKTGSGRGTKEFGSHLALRQTTADLGEVMETSNPSGFSLPGSYSARISSRLPRSLIVGARRDVGPSSSAPIGAEIGSSSSSSMSSSAMARTSRSLRRRRLAHGGSSLSGLPDPPGLWSNTLPRGGPGTRTLRASSPATRRPPALLFLASSPKSSCRRACVPGGAFFRALDRSGSWYTLDGVSDGDSRRSPGISPKREGRRGGPDAPECARRLDNSPIVQSDAISRRAACVMTDLGATLVQTGSERRSTWPRPIGSRSASSPSSHSAPSRRSSRRRRSARWSDTGAKAGRCPPGSSDPGASRDSGKRGEGRGVPGGEERDDDVVGDAASRERALHGV